MKRSDQNVPDVLVTENIVGQEMERLRSQFRVELEPDLWRSPKELRSRIGKFKALIVRNQTKVVRELIEAGSQLQIIARAGVGLENVDTIAATEAGVVVAYAPEQNTIAVAELTIGLMLSLVRRISEADASTRAGGWERQQFTGSELYGKKLGIIGLGRIGFLTAMRARAFGMDILASDPCISPDSPLVSECRAQLVGLNELLACSDVVTCHVPASSATAGLLNYEKLCLMKPTAFLINTSRGTVIDEADLTNALLEKRLAGAALDVRTIEPPAKSALCSMKNVILTPHIAAFTHESQERVVTSVCRDVGAILRGGSAMNFFNFSRPRRSGMKIDKD